MELVSVNCTTPPIKSFGAFPGSGFTSIAVLEEVIGTPSIPRRNINLNGSIVNFPVPIGKITFLSCSKA